MAPPSVVQKFRFGSPCALQKVVGELISLLFCREILREIWREVHGIVSNPQKKAKNAGEFRSILRKQLVTQKTFFVSISLRGRAALRFDVIAKICMPQQSLCNLVFLTLNCSNHRAARKSQNQMPPPCADMTT